MIDLIDLEGLRSWIVGKMKFPLVLAAWVAIPMFLIVLSRLDSLSSASVVFSIIAVNLSSLKYSKFIAL